MMKKSMVMLLACALFTVSCSVSKGVREQRNLLSGSWTLDNISYENNVGNFQSVIFDDVKDICFEGSDWFFRDNNSTGRYTIGSSSLCAEGDRFIRWSVIDGSPNQLQFKFINEKLKDIADGRGYRLNITSLTAHEMTLKSNVLVDGERVTLVYEFTKK